MRPLTNVLCFTLAAMLSMVWLTTPLAANPAYSYTELVEAGQTIAGRTLTGIQSFARNDSGALVFESVFTESGTKSGVTISQVVDFRQ